jgi:hypothetical protein
MTVDCPVKDQGAGMQNEPYRDRPFSDTLNRTPFVHKRENGMNRGYQVSRQGSQE